MPDEIKPAGESQNNGEKVKTTEEVVAEIKLENEKLAKMVKDSQDMINRQAGELGELRKKSEPQTKSETQEKDELKEEIYQKLRARGYDEVTARENAEVLKESGLAIIDKRLNERMMSEVVDLVEEAMEPRTDGRTSAIDEKIFKENEESIMSEFKARKLAPTARKNYKILRDCYDIVVRRKADTLRSENEKVESEKRDKQIAEAGQPPSGTRNLPESPDDKKVVEDIRKAGVRRENAFF